MFERLFTCKKVMDKFEQYNIGWATFGRFLGYFLGDFFHQRSWSPWLQATPAKRIWPLTGLNHSINFRLQPVETIKWLQTIKVSRRRNLEPILQLPNLQRQSIVVVR
jgi:hypothetical protein